MSEMRVECYAGYRADQRPTRFILRGRTFEITEVEDRWYSPRRSIFASGRRMAIFCFAARRSAGCLEPRRVSFGSRAATLT